MSSPPSIDTSIQVALDCAGRESNARRRLAFVIRAEIQSTRDVAVQRFGMAPGGPPFWREPARATGSSGSGSARHVGDAAARLRRRLIVADPEVQGPMPELELRESRDQYTYSLRHCLADRGWSGPRSIEKIAFSFVVNRGGSATEINVTEFTLSDATVEACVRRSIRHWVLPGFEEPSRVLMSTYFLP